MRHAFANQLAIVSGVLVILLAIIFALLQTPGQAAVTAVATAPVIPHPLVGYENCVECHGHNGAVPYPLNHLGWPSSSCTQCHLPADAIALGDAVSVAPADAALLSAREAAEEGTQPLADEGVALTPVDQFTSGEGVFNARCASCHMTGGAGPVLNRAALSKYRTALELFAYTRRTMPPGAPGSLPDQHYWDVVAYMLAAQDLLPADTIIGPTTAGDVTIQ